jgi:hypothetical protein
MWQGIVAFLVLLLVLVGGRYLFFRAQRGKAAVHVPRTGGTLVLRRSRRIGVLLAVGALLPSLLFVAVTFRAWSEGRAGMGGLLFSGAVILLALAFSAHQFLAAFRSHLAVDERGLERVGVFTRRRVAWEELARVAYNPRNRWFFLTARDGTHLWVDETVDGAGDFAVLALARVPPEALAGDRVAREVLEDLAEAAAAAS